MFTSYNSIIDAYVFLWLKMYYWPYFVMGNLDEWAKMGVTLNGIRPSCTK